MHHFILPTQDSWISSGSHTENSGDTFINQNFGSDKILEIKKIFQNNVFDYQTRALVNFAGDDFTSLSQSIVNGDIPTDAEYYLRLFEADGTSELSEDYTLAAYPLYQSWTEGVGKSEDNPKNKNGVSWKNTTYPINGSPLSWSYRQASKELAIPGDEDLNGIEFNEYHVTFGNGNQVFGNITGSNYLGGDDGDNQGGVWIERKGYVASQSFSSESTDVEMNVTDMVNKWLNTISNYGMLLKFSGSQETDSTTFGHLKFFSKDSNTIFQPKLEVRWDEHLPCTGSNTGSLSELTMTGLDDNYLYIKSLRDSYIASEKVKFRVGARKRYLTKSVSTSVQSITDSYISEGSGSYAIKDIATDEFIVPFSEYTLIGCDTSGPYFNQWLNGFYPDRAYKILLKLKYTDGQEQIFDDDFKFTIRGE